MSRPLAVKCSPLRRACQNPEPATQIRTISTTSPPVRPERYPWRLHTRTSTSRSRPQAIRMNGQYSDTSSKICVSGSRFLHMNTPPETQIFELVSLYWPFILIAWGLLRLVEVLVWSRQGYRSGLTGGEVVLIVLICVAGSGFWQARRSGLHFTANGLDIWGQQYDYPISASASAAGMKRIV